MVGQRPVSVGLGQVLFLAGSNDYYAFFSFYFSQKLFLGHTQMCVMKRVGIVVSTKKGVYMTQKEVSETEINAKVYGQGVSLFVLDALYHLLQSKFPFCE